MLQALFAVPVLVTELGICPPFPKLPNELLQPAPTLYLLPKEMQGW